MSPIETSLGLVGRRSFSVSSCTISVVPTVYTRRRYQLYRVHWRLVVWTFEVPLPRLIGSLRAERSSQKKGGCVDSPILDIKIA